MGHRHPSAELVQERGIDKPLVSSGHAHALHMATSEVDIPWQCPLSEMMLLVEVCLPLKPKPMASTHCWA